MMDFIVDLPCRLGGCDLIWVFMDRLTKLTHFLPIKTTYKVIHLTRLFIVEIVRLHGVLTSIMSDRKMFWKAFHHAMGEL